MYKLVTPILDFDVRRLCFKAYYNHPKGCPNYNKKIGCPPTSKTIDKKIDLNKSVYAVWNKFDFASHCKRMKSKHPDWTIRQVECCLYWQSKARKQLKKYIYEFLSEHRNFIIVNCPEGGGVNLTATMKNIGINLEWPPKNITYQIVLAGYKI